MMARRARASAPKEQEIELLTALRFIEVAQRDDGVPYQTHCWFANGYVNAFDGILAAGFPVSGGMPLGCPHTKKLIAALSKVRGAYGLTMLDNHQLSVSTDKLKVAVPCLSPIDLDRVVCDPPNYTLTDKFKEAAELAGMFVKEGAQSVLGASVVTRDYSLFGTDTIALVEAYHGCHMPAGLMIPKAFISAMLKVPAALTHFGFCEQSLTVHFENGGWLRTQLYIEQPPKLDTILSTFAESKTVPIPVELRAGLEAVLPHAEGNRVILLENEIRTSLDENVGAVYRCDGLPFNVPINGGLLRTMTGVFDSADFVTHKNYVVFTDSEKQVRGILAKMAR